jgi:hypothetical protein
MHGPESPHPALARAYNDIDLVTNARADRAVSELLVSLGYEVNRTFNTLNSGRRGLFYDRANERRLDLFVGAFEMCHKIPIADRLDLDPMTVPLAELLLTKLQIVHLNNKDLKDTVALLLEHAVGEGDQDMVNVSYVSQMCANDWGLWRTCTLNINRVGEMLNDLQIGARETSLVRERLSILEVRLQAEPKSLRWRLRARVGDRVSWYMEPEELGQDT